MRDHLSAVIEAVLKATEVETLERAQAEVSKNARNVSRGKLGHTARNRGAAHRLFSGLSSLLSTVD